MKQTILLSLAFGLLFAPAQSYAKETKTKKILKIIAKTNAGIACAVLAFLFYKLSTHEALINLENEAIKNTSARDILTLYSIWDKCKGIVTLENAEIAVKTLRVLSIASAINCTFWSTVFFTSAYTDYQETDWKLYTCLSSSGFCDA